MIIVEWVMGNNTPKVTHGVYVAMVMFACLCDQSLPTEKLVTKSHHFLSIQSTISLSLSLRMVVLVVVDE